MLPGWLRDLLRVFGTTTGLFVGVLVLLPTLAFALLYLLSPLGTWLCDRSLCALYAIAVSTLAVALVVALLALLARRGYLTLPDVW